MEPKEQVLGLGVRLPRRTRLAQGQGAADLKADASAAGPPANRKAAELRALDGPFRGRMDVFESI